MLQSKSSTLRSVEAAHSSSSASNRLSSGPACAAIAAQRRSFCASSPKVITARIRLDSHMSAGAMIPPFYDSMIGKLIVHGSDRADALAKLTVALDAFRVKGVPTTIDLHRAIVAHPDFIANNIHTRWLEQVLLPERAAVAT